MGLSMTGVWARVAATQAILYNRRPRYYRHGIFLVASVLPLENIERVTKYSAHGLRCVESK